MRSFRWSGCIALMFIAGLILSGAGCQEKKNKRQLGKFLIVKSDRESF